ncbi:MAG: GSU2403 family nucleotidyltransferase fold protein [Candidatus Humimicrobiaceae bacterium]
MERKNSLFFNTLKALHEAGVLEDIILIGSWCHYFYRIYFSNANEIPLLRTLDIDFLIPNPHKIHKDVNIPKLLGNLDFISSHDYLTGYTKYVHPEIELEFLIAELGRGKGNKPYEIPKLHINAQGLRFLNLLQSHTIKIEYENFNVIVPEPAAYVLHKFIIQERRLNKEKQKRDLQSAKEIGEFLLQNKTQQKKITDIFNSLPDKWQKLLLKILKDYSKLLYEFLLINIKNH